MLRGCSWQGGCTRAFQAAQQPDGRRSYPRGIQQRRRPAQASTPVAATATAAAGDASTDQEAGLPQFEFFSMEELQQSLKQRRLSTEGGRPELEQRLASFLANPGSFPEADCRPRQMLLLGGRLFCSKPQLRRHVQLLMQLLQGQEVDEQHADFSFLLSLLQQHPRYAEKVTPPVSCFRVRAVVAEPDMPPYAMFEYRDARGEWEDFSYRKCIGFDPDWNGHLTFRDAMRHAVIDQLAAFRLASLTKTERGRAVYRCDCCRKKVPDGRKLRAEHVEPSFPQLVKDFCASTPLTPPPVDGQVPGSNRGCFTDEAWLEAWRSYHRKNVQRMQLLCYSCMKRRHWEQTQQDEREANGGGGGGGKAAPRAAPKAAAAAAKAKVKVVSAA